MAPIEVFFGIIVFMFMGAAAGSTAACARAAQIAARWLLPAPSGPQSASRPDGQPGQRASQARASADAAAGTKSASA